MGYICRFSGFLFSCFHVATLFFEPGDAQAGLLTKAPEREHNEVLFISATWHCSHCKKHWVQATLNHCLLSSPSYCRLLVPFSRYRHQSLCSQMSKLLMTDAEITQKYSHHTLLQHTRRGLWILEAPSSSFNHVNVCIMFYSLDISSHCGGVKMSANNIWSRMHCFKPESKQYGFGQTPNLQKISKGEK